MTMGYTDVSWNLCSRDPRHPLWAETYGDLPADEVPGKLEQRACFCDSCHSGRRNLAEEIIRLREVIETLKQGHEHGAL